MGESKWYIGAIVNSHVFEAFASKITPTQLTHGDMYAYTIGPFRTKRAAKWAERYGRGNPHFRHVDDAERLALTV